jgi:uncharacterized protein (TIGR03790 family)
MESQGSFCIAGTPFAYRDAETAAWTADVLAALANLGLGLVLGLASSPLAQAQSLSPAVQQAVVQVAEANNAASAVPLAPPPATAAPAARKPAWVSVPRITGRLQAADIGVVINTDDLLSVQIGSYYISARRLKPKQVLRVKLPVRSALTAEEFEGLREAIDQRFGSGTQALALAWAMPYAVSCNAITGALALGFDAEFCQRNCTPSRPSRYFNSASNKPLRDHGLRLSMLLAARNFKDAKAMIDRGVASDGTLGLRGRPPVSALMLATDDVPRRVRMPLYPPQTLLREFGVDVKHLPEAALQSTADIVMAITGSIKPSLMPRPDWVPGGLGDHLTSYGGDLFGEHGQDTVLHWLESGATASHGAVTEPCNHPQKFPHPQVLLMHYIQGSTAIEAYWKSVLWPQQSLFVGEPLAAPFVLNATSRPAPPPTQFSVPRLIP